MKCLVLCNAEKCKVCCEKEKQHQKQEKKTAEKKREPAKLNVPISLTSPERVIYTKHAAVSHGK